MRSLYETSDFFVIQRSKPGLEKGCHGAMIINGLLQYKWPHERSVTALWMTIGFRVKGSSIVEPAESTVAKN